ncbi:MAG: hypothetical protein CL897_06065 [Dehalococcoidia bacterium]|nr:hypothetical protein [Dehalococcoidia bacterium]|tara:strand:+ start:1113 stop:1901 length:789 start_codon:yes stop_codon:yes gene_type:complete
MGKDIDLQGKVALITGGGQGIGKGIAKVLGECGATVVVSDINPDTTAATAAELGAKALPLNVADQTAFNAAIDQIVAEQGSLDILVNNAGVYREYGGAIETITPEMWRTLWSVNVDGVFFGCQAAARVMVAAGNGGRIINIASTQAVSPGVGVTYDGSKAAVVQITRTLALELGRHNITVNAVAPGATWVNPGDPPPIDSTAPIPRSGQPLGDAVASRIARIPAGRWAVPEDIGNSVAFVASPLASYINGVYLNVDGGWLTE